MIASENTELIEAHAWLAAQDLELSQTSRDLREAKAKYAALLTQHQGYKEALNASQMEELQAELESVCEDLELTQERLVTASSDEQNNSNHLLTLKPE